MTQTSSTTSINVLIAASGSGGHLLPALAIARAVEESLPNVKVCFIGAGRALESELIEGAGYPLEILPLQPLRRLGIKGLLKFIATLPYSLFKTSMLLRKIKPDLAIGVGGYASVLPVLTARVLGAKAMIHEAERTPGWANKFLAHFVHKITTAHQNTAFSPKAPTVWTGHPLRKQLLETDFTKALATPPKNLFIVGGSQGANSLDQLSTTLAPYFATREIEVTHQCRPENKTTVEDNYRQNSVKASVQTFISDMSAIYKWCDFVIARSGAGLVRELELIGRPCILVPLPQAEEQRSNAEDLEKTEQAVIIEESESFIEDVKNTLDLMLEAEDYQRRARYTDSASRGEDPAKRIAKVASALLKR